jgi:single-strand DNA-binding protein
VYNHITLIGNTTRDTEVTYTPGGTAIAKIAMAVNSKLKKGDAMQEKVLFITATVFGKQAESCGKFLSKGDPVLVEGRLEINEWEKDGIKKSKAEIIARDVRFMPKRDRQKQAGNGNGTGVEEELMEEVTDLEPFPF